MALFEKSLPCGTNTFPDAVWTRNCGSKSPSASLYTLLRGLRSSPVCVCAVVSRWKCERGGTSGPMLVSSSGGGGMGGIGNVAAKWEREGESPCIQQQTSWGCLQLSAQGYIYRSTDPARKALTQKDKNWQQKWRHKCWPHWLTNHYTDC